MKEIIWRRQGREGVQDCYAKGYDDCTEHNCHFWGSCLDEVIEDWERENINKYGEING